jgi:hypothetical protein
MEWPEIIRGHFALRSCAMIQRRCVICGRQTANYAVQVMELGDDGEMTGDVVCPDCSRSERAGQEMPTFEEWRHVFDEMEAWDSDDDDPLVF